MTQIIKTTLNVFSSTGFVPTLQRICTYVYKHIIFFFLVKKIPLCKKKNDIDHLTNQVFKKHHLVITPKQRRPEVTKLLEDMVKIDVKNVLEIGTDKGGNLLLISKSSAPDATIISVDLPGGKFGGGYPFWRTFLYKRFASKSQKIHLIRGNSQVQSTLSNVKTILKGAKLDMLFIDGDHSYIGVKKDYEIYEPYVKNGGLICFHDIVPNSNDLEIEVPKFWAEVKKGSNYVEYFSQESQTDMGIGVIYK